MSNEDRKVIQLPVKRKAPEQKPVSNGDSNPPPLPTAKPKSRKFRFDREQRKILVSASLVTILFGVTMANRALLDDEPLTNIEAFQSHNPSRSIASVAPTMDKVRNAEWERELASELTNKGTRGPASIGKTPSVEEKLQFGFLEGKYAVQMNEGKIQNLRFVAVSEHPKYLKSAPGFLTQHMDLMPADFENARLIQREETGGTVKETYSLDHGSDSVGKVAIEMDHQGRLLTLAVVE